MEQDQQIVTRIGFAEQWLDRAKQQCAEGNLARGWLTLVLADAEMHHALQAAAPSVRPRPRRTIAAILVATAAVVTVIIGTRWQDRPGTLSLEPGPPIVRLSAPVGQLLEITVPASPARAGAPAQATSPGRRSATRIVPPTASSVIGRSTAPPSAPVSAPPSPAPVITGQPPGSFTPSPQSPSQMVSVPAVSTRSPEISAGELIDLVLAAERTLRSDADRP